MTKKLTIIAIIYALFLLMPAVVRAGGCYSGGYNYGYRSSYYSPSYYAPSYSYAPSYGYNYSYSPAFWYNNAYYPAGSYAYSNGTYYRQGYGAYYGLPYSTAAVEVAAPQPVVFNVEIPQVNVVAAPARVNAREVEVAPPTATATATVTTGGGMTPRTASSASITSDDVKALVGEIQNMRASLKDANAVNEKLAASVVELKNRVGHIENFLSKPTTIDPQAKDKAKPEAKTPPPVPKGEAPPMPKADNK